MTLISINNKTIEKLNERILELMNDKGMIAPYLASSLVNRFTPENKKLFRFKKDVNLTKMNDFLINRGKPVTLFSNMLTFRDSIKSFNLDGDLLATMKLYDFNVSHCNPQDQKLIYESGKEMNFNIEQKGRGSERDKSMIILLKSPAIMASGVTTMIMAENPDELCNGLNLLIKEKHGRNYSDLFNKGIIAIVDKYLEINACLRKNISKF